MKPGPKKVRIYAGHTHEALGLLGKLIRVRRIERGMQVQALAERVGVSRDLMHRM